MHPSQAEYLLPPVQPSLYAANSYYQLSLNTPAQIPSSSSMVAPGSLMCFENPPATQAVIENEVWVMVSEAIEVFEYYFSIGNISSDWYLRELMDKNLWVPLESILPFRRMHLYGIRTFKQLQDLAVKTSTFTDCTNVVLDNSKLFVRPRWADWSEIKIKANFANRNMKRAKRKRLVRTAIQEAVDSITSRKDMMRETKHPMITLFGREENGIFTASFNASGVPSLIAPFLTKYEIKGGTLSITKTTNSMFTEDFFSINGPRNI